MAELKTQRTGASVQAFLDAVPDGKKRADSQGLLELMRDVTGEEPEMWGPSIVGFGGYRHKYASGREGEWPLVGLSPRRRYLTLYLMSGFDDYDALLDDLGKYKTGKACICTNKLEDVDPAVLRQLISQSVEHVAGTHS